MIKLETDEPMTGLMKEDYIMRLVEMMTQALIRLAGLRETHRFDEAEMELDAAYETLLGSNAELFRRIDARTGAELLTDPQKAAMLSDLLHEEAEQLRAVNGYPEPLDRLALEYALEALMAKPDSDEMKTRVQKLAPLVEEDLIDERYQEALINVRRASKVRRT
jgi:hypothetical protein